MSNQHFRLLYREFLLRVVELELLSPAGDPSKLLGQFAALLVFVNLLMSFGAFAATGTHAWMIEHTLIATTMLVVGLFAVLSWDSIFPNQRDVFVLGPLPVPIRTIFLAKVGASFAALALSIAAINPLTGIALPLALAQPSTNLVDMILSPRLYRALDHDGACRCVRLLLRADRARSRGSASVEAAFSEALVRPADGRVLPVRQHIFPGAVDRDS